MGSKVYSMRVTEDLAKDIDKRCAEQNISAAETLRKLVDDYIIPAPPWEMRTRSCKGKGYSVSSIY